MLKRAQSTKKPFLVRRWCWNLDQAYLSQRRYGDAKDTTMSVFKEESNGNSREEHHVNVEFSGWIQAWQSTTEKGKQMRNERAKTEENWENTGRAMGPAGRVWLISSLMLLSIQFVSGLQVGSGDLIERTAQDEDDGAGELPDLENSGAKFDYFVFSQQWPGTFCRQRGACCNKLTKPVKFTIHGLWPENNDNTYPSCCSGPGFDEAKVASLHEFLDKFWPTLSCRSPRQCRGKTSGPLGFWQHEWEKHGTCSYPTIPDEGTYFSVGLNLNQRYDISKILSEAGFIPSYKRYKTSELKAAVADAVGAKPAFSCKGQLINEIWICLTKDLKIRDCGMPANTCGTYTEIPPFAARSELTELGTFEDL